MRALQCIACIPCYTLVDDEERKATLKSKYENERDIKYLEAKEFYEQNIFVGMTWYGGFKDISMTITKINTLKGYVCSSPSNQQKRYIEKMSAESGVNLRTSKKVKMSFANFLSALKQGTIKRLNP